MPRVQTSNAVAVIGLGRFGWAVAEQLMRMGREVLAVEREPDLVEKYAPYLTLCVEGDATNPDVLKQLGIDELPHAVVGIGDSLENSILAVAALSDLGVPQIWAKALSKEHGRILERVGATKVVRPEHEMGNRVAHALMGRINEYIEFPNGYAITMVSPPKALVGLSLTEAQLRSRHGVTAIGIERPDGTIDYTKPDTRVHADDRLVIAGRIERVEKFALLET